VVESERLLDLSLDDFLKRLASDAPTPGGGAVAALAGALAAGLGRMVAALTIGRKRFAQAEPQVREVDERLAGAERMLHRLIEEDAAAYGVLSEALKRDKNDPQRAESVRQAASLAGTVPLETVTVSAGLLADLEQLRALGNPLLGPDVEAGVQMARAAMHAGAENVRANLGLMRPEDARLVEQQLQAVLQAHPGPGQSA
jgi:formiminotetrahydrofolate cyclodeaminase